MSKQTSFAAPLLKLVQSVSGTSSRQPRRAPRLPVKVTALLKMPAAQPPIAVMLKNISVGGASMTTHLRLKLNDRVTLLFKLGRELEMEIRARVVHNGGRNSDFKCQYGLKFHNITQHDYERLAAYIHDPRNGWQFDAPPPPWSPDAA